MAKPIIARLNTIEQWRLHTNRISDNLGDPAATYITDAPDNTVSGGYTNTTDSYTHPVDQLNAFQALVNDLNSRKVKRTGDTISGSLNIKTNLYVAGIGKFGGDITQSGTGNLSVTATGTATISPTGITTLGTVGVATNVLGNVSATTSNQTVTLSPTGASGTVTIAPGTLAGTINNMSIGATTRSTGAFTSLAANGAVTFTQNTDNTLGTAASGTVQVTGGVGTSGNVTVGGDIQVKGGDVIIEGTPNLTAATVTNAAGLFSTTTGTITLGAATSTLTAQSKIINMSTAAATYYVSVLANDTASSTTTGAFRVAGGVGIAKALYVGGDVNASGTANTSFSQTGTFGVSNTGNVTINNTGTLSLTNTAGITIANSTSGTISITSFAAGTINNMSIGATTRSTGAFTSLAANGAVTFTQNTASTSTTTGTLVVTGGAGLSGALYAVGVYSDTISSVGSGGNGDLTLSGIGTGIVKVSDNLTVTGSITSDVGDIVLSTGSDTTQTITSGVAASTASVFATSNTSTLNLGDNADVNIGNVSKTTTIRGASTLTGNVTVSGSSTFATGTGNLSLNGNVVTAIKMADASNLNNEYLTVRTTTAATAATAILTFSATTYASAEIIVQIWDATASVRQFTKLLLTYNGTDTSLTEYGTVIAGASQLGTFSSDINTGNIRLLVTPKTTNSMVYRISVNRFYS